MATLDQDTTTIQIEDVDWDDPAAVAMRVAMTAEMRIRYADRQPDAVRLYEKSGYTRIPIFAPYEAHLCIVDRID